MVSTSRIPVYFVHSLAPAKAVQDPCQIPQLANGTLK